MSILSKIGNIFKSLGGIIVSALKSAAVNGLTDSIVEEAKKWAKVAAGKELDNAAKREFVVKILTSKGIPESISRLAVELAVQALKAELKKV